MVVTPPKIPPARLFRALLQRPRATAALVVPGFDVGLSVRALTAQDEAEIGDAGKGFNQDRARMQCASELLLRAVLTDGMPAFATAADIDALYEHEALKIAKAARAALDTMSPTYSGRFDVTAWRRALVEGAKDYSNITQALVLGGCIDVSYGYGIRHTVERPDRYFGVPIAEITDGQMMAYRAGREVYMEHTKK